MMDEQTKEQWNALRKSFDDRNQQLFDDYTEHVNTIEDRHRADERNREDRKYQFLAKLKNEHRESADIYIKCLRNERKTLREKRAALELERQETYAKFKSEHGMWGGEDNTQSPSK